MNRQVLECGIHSWANLSFLERRSLWATELPEIIFASPRTFRGLKEAQGRHEIITLLLLLQLDERQAGEYSGR